MMKLWRFFLSSISKKEKINPKIRSCAEAKRDVHDSDSDSGGGSPQEKKEVKLLVPLPPKVVKLRRVCFKENTEKRPTPSITQLLGAKYKQ